MTNSSVTVDFLMSIDGSLKNAILKNIANHYGITETEAWEEITDSEAENIMDYVTDEIRPAVSLFFNKFLSSYSKN